MALKDKFKGDSKKSLNSKEPVWQGPSGTGANGGISFSLLSRFLVCRERFRINAIEGIRVKEKFNHLLEFGNMWHACEEAFAKGEVAPTQAITEYAKLLCKKYPFQQEEITHWHDMITTLFPVYIDFWKQHPDTVSYTPVMQEHVFDVMYQLPSGRTVRLRGKWDSVDLTEANQQGGYGIRIQENKSKSSIDQQKISRQLSFDLQTMMYVIALLEEQSRLDDSTVKARTSYKEGKFRHFYQFLGVRYNVVRRSAHKSPESMMKKVIEDIGAGRGNEWFARWNVDIRPHDIKVFKETCLNPVLEDLCNWWHLQQYKNVTDIDDADWIRASHYRRPFGVYNVLDEGGSSDLDAYLADGSMIGLERTTNLFPELQQ